MRVFLRIPRVLALAATNLKDSSGEIVLTPPHVDIRVRVGTLKSMLVDAPKLQDLNVHSSPQSLTIGAEEDDLGNQYLEGFSIDIEPEKNADGEINVSIDLVVNVDVTKLAQDWNAEVWMNPQEVLHIVYSPQNEENAGGMTKTIAFIDEGIFIP